MEMLSSFRGNKHEFCLVVVNLKYVGGCITYISVDITYT